MDFDLTEDQEQLRGVLRGFFERHAPESAVRAAIDTPSGYDEAVWQQFIEQIGVVGLLVAEEHDGLGMSLVDAGVVLEEMGRRLYTAPFLGSSVVCAHILSESTEPAAAELLESIADGSLILSLASAEADGDWTSDTLETTATATGDDWSVTGTKSYVLDSVDANHFLVTAATGDGVGIFAIEASSASIQPIETLDLTRKIATVTFGGAPAALIADAASGALLIDDALAVAVVALAAEQLGAAQQCLSSAVEYANVRVQFGETIGHFQAVQHRLADMLVEIEAARAAVYYGLWVASQRIDGWQDHARVAKIIASDALSYAAAESLHLHGGNGFTWEFPEHLYFRRARSSELLFGSPTFHREKLARALGV